MSVFVAQRKLKMFPTCLVPAACAQARTADGDALPKGGTYENSVERKNAALDGLHFRKVVVFLMVL